jgi:hypothetical protein
MKPRSTFSFENIIDTANQICDAHELMPCGVGEPVRQNGKGRIRDDFGNEHRVKLPPDDLAARRQHSYRSAHRGAQPVPQCAKVASDTPLIPVTTGTDFGSGQVALVIEPTSVPEVRGPTNALVSPPRQQTPRYGVPDR